MRQRVIGTELNGQAAWTNAGAAPPEIIQWMPIWGGDRAMSDKKNGTLSQPITHEKVGQWRSTVRKFFSSSWAEVQEVIEALEREMEEPVPAPAPPSAPPSPRSEPVRREPSKAGESPPSPPHHNATTTESASIKSKRSSPAAPAQSGSAQDERLAELARRIEERLRQSKS